MGEDLFEHHGLDVKDAEMLFRILAASVETEEVEIFLLIDGLLKMRGPAASLDLITMLFEMRIYQASNVHFQQQWEKQVEQLILCIQSQSKELHHRHTPLA